MDGQQQNQDMSLQWNGSQQDDKVRPAGYGPTQQEFYSGVAQAMLANQDQAMRHMAYEVARAQRGGWLTRWREWVTYAAGIGIVLFWIACWMAGGKL
jgi:hypothetical protein